MEGAAGRAIRGRWKPLSCLGAGNVGWRCLPLVHACLLRMYQEAKMKNRFDRANDVEKGGKALVVHVLATGLNTLCTALSDLCFCAYYVRFIIVFQPALKAP